MMINRHVRLLDDHRSVLVAKRLGKRMCGTHIQIEDHVMTYRQRLRKAPAGPSSAHGIASWKFRGLRA